MINWDDIRLFVAVARAGGLAGATKTTNLSPPTLGRRLLALEQNLGVTLFIRHRSGYDLTPAGHELLARSATLEQGAMAIEQWRTIIDPRPTIKIAAGSWTASFIAKNIGQILPRDNSVRIELLSGAGFLDLSRREANLGIRNKRPHQTGLAGRKIGQVEFAIYGAQSYVAQNPAALSPERFQTCEWVTLSAQAGPTPSLSWLEQYMPRPARITCTSSQAILDAANAAAGLCVLPCFVGDNQPRLTRVSDTIQSLASTRWLVSHDDDRHTKSLRMVANQVANLFLGNQNT